MLLLLPEGHSTVIDYRTQNAKQQSQHLSDFSIILYIVIFIPNFKGISQTFIRNRRQDGETAEELGNYILLVTITL